MSAHGIYGCRILVGALLVVMFMAGCRDSYPPADNSVNPLDSGATKSYKLTGPRWNLIKLGSPNQPSTNGALEDVDQYYGAYAEFNANGNLVGYGGCNFYSGTYASTAAGSLTITSAQATTNVSCGGPRQTVELSLLSEFSRAQSYRIADDTLEITLSNLGTSGIVPTVMKFVAGQRGSTLARYIDIESGIKFFLPHGARGVMVGETVSVTIDSVIDSRCPIGVQCAWAGDAEVRLRMKIDGIEQVVAIHSNPQAGKATADVPPYHVELVAVDPYPDISVNNGIINPAEYTAALIITKN